MYLFLITFLIVYGGMHLYAFLKLCHAFQPRPLIRWFLISWISVMTVIPLLVRAAEQLQLERAALFFAWPGYLWMGFLFIFCSVLLFSDAVRLFYRVIIRFFYIRLPEHISTFNAYRYALVLALCASVYAFIEAGQIRTNHIVITSSKLPLSLSGIRIVQISDLHIGLLLQKTRLQRILAKVREAKPDILVSTGDLVDGKLNRSDVISGLNPLAALIAAVPAPSGKFAIIGNHEVYAGLRQAVAFSRAAGFTMLRNQSLQLTSGITISGVDDRAANRKSSSGAVSEAALLNSVSPGSYHLLLKHRPEILMESDGRFDLQLSGHVHGGQIFPFNLLVKLRFPIPCGTTKTPAGSVIYVSRGTGTWGPPMRLFAPPEITVIDIISPHQR